MKTKIRPTEVPRDASINGLIIDARCVKFTQNITAVMNHVKHLSEFTMRHFQYLVNPDLYTINKDLIIAQLESVTRKDLFRKLQSNVP